MLLQRAMALCAVLRLGRSAALSARTVRRGLMSMATGAPECTKGEVRYRFAPSPTGSLHVGGARTALYNWLAARKAGNNGKFVLRIEDTDQARSTKESEDSMLADLEWLGLDWDEGPRVGGPCELYRQSERTAIYKEAAEKLVASGNAYPCFCTEAELEEKKQKIIAAGGTGDGYDGTWRDADADLVKTKLAAGDPCVYRFRTEPGKTVQIQDVVRGSIEWDVESTIGDFILLRSTGVPVYNFCVAVDDATMGVSTVVRAEEHLTNTLRQMLVLEALGFEPPRYAHASLILGSDRSKLSKRHGATSCGQFRERGYLADAMINYLALLGWNSGTEKEIYSREELIDAFDLDRVVPSPAMFDDDKLRWINGQHLRAMAPEALAKEATELLLPLFTDAPCDKLILAATKMAQPKSELLTDVTALTTEALAYPLLETVSGDNKKVKKVVDEGFAAFALELVASYERGEAPSICYTDKEGAAETFEAWLLVLGERTGRSKKQVFMPVRLALTGRMAGPDVAAQLSVLSLAAGANLAVEFVPLADRLDQLKKWANEQGAPAPMTDAESSSNKKDTEAPPLSFEAFQLLRPVYEANRRHCEGDREMYDLLVKDHDEKRLKIQTKIDRNEQKLKKKEEKAAPQQGSPRLATAP